MLVTGAAGFIGFHLSQKLVSRGFQVIGIDNLNDYYDVTLKHSRLDILKKLPAFTFIPVELADAKGINKIFAEQKPDYVVNLAAQAGVRYSLVNPHAYLESTCTAF